MFGSSSPPKDSLPEPNSTASSAPRKSSVPRSPQIKQEASPPPSDDNAMGEKRGVNIPASGEGSGAGEKKRRSSGVGQKASSLLASAKNSLHFSASPNSSGFGRSPDTQGSGQTSLQKLGKQDPALSVPQGQHNNSAGESRPGPRSTFRVGVWEDKNKKCRRTMEDTHAFLYNFLHTPAPALKSEHAGDSSQKSQKSMEELNLAASTNSVVPNNDMQETDNGYFAIFDGHAGTFAADWCGKKLHVILEEIIRKNPNSPIPELLDQTFTSVDNQLSGLPVKNSGCTAVCAVLRWEDRIPNNQSATGSTAIAPAIAAVKAWEEGSKGEFKSEKSEDSGVDMSKNASQQPNAAASVASNTSLSKEDKHKEMRSVAQRQRVLYTANVGDARIVLCRGGKALRLSYDHKGSDEAEGKRVSNAGGLILNNRVNGVLAVTRALGDAYMKDLVTGHPYTTETVIQPDIDEFIILACDGLWDVCQDQEAVDLIRNIQDPHAASKFLVEHALARFSTDNLSCMVVRFEKKLLLDASKNRHDAIGVEGDPLSSAPNKISEVEKIVGDAKRKVEEDGVPGIGVSGSNSGKGHDPVVPSSSTDSMERVVEEEPSLVEGDSKEVNLEAARELSPDTRRSLSKGIPEGAE